MEILTVKQLIELLSDCPQDYSVYTDADWTSYVATGIHVDDKDKRVVIE